MLLDVSIPGLCLLPYFANITFSLYSHCIAIHSNKTYTPGAFLGHFTEYALLVGSGGTPRPCMGPGESMWQKYLRAFQKAKISSQDMQLNSIICIFLPKVKINTVKPGLGGHSEEDRCSLNAGQKYCRMLKEHSAIVSTFIKLQFFIKIRFYFLSIFDLLRKVVHTCVGTPLYTDTQVQRLTVSFAFYQLANF